MNDLALRTSSLPRPCARPSRRGATRREVVLPCQAVRERDFRLIADRTLDVSVDGLLLPVEDPAILEGESLIVSFPIPGIWIDVECSVARIIRGRRPADDGLFAVGVLFDVISPSARAALAGYLHGRPPPLPRRGPFARLRRGSPAPRLEDEAIMSQPLPVPILGGSTGATRGGGVDPVGILRELASAWKGLGVTDE